ncbi:MAG: ATP-binding protein [Rhodobacter sp.]|nr:ATP-binding protein [Rhodobacter sp.]
MTDTAQPPNSLTRLAIAAAPRSGQILIPAVLCFGLAIAFAGGFAGALFLVTGVTLACLAGLVLGLDQLHSLRRARLFAIVRNLAELDPAISFLTDETGRILFRNAAAARQVPDGAVSLFDVIRDYVASPPGVLARMRVRADARAVAVEDLPGEDGGMRLSAARTGGVYLWRLDCGAQAQAGKMANLALAAMRVGKTGTILDMSPAMETLLGARPKTLDRAINDLPLRPGRLHQLATAKGPLAAYLAVVDEPGGNRQVVVWPGDPPDRDWTQSDAIPVPLMKLAISGKILMANGRARQLLCLPEDGGLDFADVVEGLGRPIDDWLLDVSEGRGANRTEVVRATRAQKDVYLQVALGRMIEGNDVSLLAVLIDATELKTLEAQFVQSQKMQAIGQLAGGVAHDFNNLLTAISGHCDLLLLRHEQGDPNYGDLVQINQNANRAASLVGQLLAFSRKQNMQPELIDLRDTLGDLTHLLNRLVGEKIDLTWTHDPDLPRVRADKRQLEQVLMNLVVNARDAMPEGGAIRVVTRSMRLTDALTRDRAAVPPGEYVVVTVEDEGCGIPADKLPKIFEPFYSTKRLGEGTGLGLSMAYGIVKQSGGFIFADSVIGSGSSFTMYFPAHRGTYALPPPEKKDRAKSVANADGGVVLLVEDEAPVRAFASRALRLRGFTVIEADSAEDALRTLEDVDLQVDVFVTDVVMPGMDGPSWVSRALRQRPGVRVVFVSGYAEDSFSHNRAKIPNSVFLPKPFSLSQLTETVQRQMQ